jgi:tRNA (cmo5U34)-methyltransferase
MDDTTDFSFALHARGFLKHIYASVPDHKDGLIPTCVGLSRRFAQRSTTVLDVGCSTGHVLASIRKANQATGRQLEYVGIDIEPGFRRNWQRMKAENLRFEVADATTYRGYENLSQVLCLFTLQFIRPVDKLPLLHRIYNGLLAGGALIIAEKTLAETSRVQDAWTFPYYDHKLRKGFSADDILRKERSLRGQMTLWTERELRSALRSVGFSDIESIWRNQMFVGVLALKPEFQCDQFVCDLPRACITGCLQRDLLRASA